MLITYRTTLVYWIEHKPSLPRHMHTVNLCTTANKIKVLITEVLTAVDFIDYYLFLNQRYVDMHQAGIS